MAETTADVRREIEMTRERMSGTIDELEQKLNVKQMVRDNPWPALGLAFAAGVLLSGSKADVKAAAATLAATKGASSKVGVALDDIVATLMSSVTNGINGRVDQWVSEIKTVIGTPRQAEGQDGARKSTSGYGVGPVDLVAERGVNPPGNIPRAD